MTMDWYGNRLVGAPGSLSAKGNSAPIAENSDHFERKEVLVFLKVELNHTRKTEDINFLSEILRACRLSLTDIALFDGAGPGDLDTLRTQCDPRTMLMIGITPAEVGLPIHFPHFQLQMFDGIQLLSLPPIGDFRNDKVLKSKLWNLLKQIFSL